MQVYIYAVIHWDTEPFNVCQTLNWVKFDQLKEQQVDKVRELLSLQA